MKEDEKNRVKYEGDPLKSAPILFSIPKKQDFEVPEGYFEKLPLKIQERVSSDRTVWEKISGIILKPQIALPAFLILIIMVVGISYLKQKDPRSENVVALVKTDTIETLVDKDVSNTQIKVEDLSQQQIEQIDQEMIVEEMDEDLIFEEEIVFSTEDQVAVNNESEEMDFLIENNIDVSLIIDEIQLD